MVAKDCMLTLSGDSCLGVCDPLLLWSGCITIWSPYLKPYNIIVFALFLLESVFVAAILGKNVTRFWASKRLAHLNYTLFLLFLAQMSVVNHSIILFSSRSFGFDDSILYLVW